MNCDIVESLISESLERELTEFENYSIDVHVENCVDCNLFHFATSEISKNEENKIVIKELSSDKIFNEKVMEKVNSFSDTNTITFSAEELFPY